MNIEELWIKLGIKAEGMKEGANAVKEQMDHVKHELHELGIHAESRGKTFKKMFKELAEMSPLLANTWRAFMDPVQAGMMVLKQAIHAVKHAYEEDRKALEEMAKSAAKAYAIREEAANKAHEAVTKRAETQAEFEKKLDEEKPGEKQSREVSDKIRKAKEESGGDDVEFLKKKQAIELEASQAAAVKETAALEKMRGAQKFTQDEKSIATLEELKAKQKGLLEEELKAKQELELSQHLTAGDIKKAYTKGQHGTDLPLRGFGEEPYTYQEMAEAHRDVRVKKAQTEFDEAQRRRKFNDESISEYEKYQREAGDIVKSAGAEVTGQSNLRKKLAEDAANTALELIAAERKAREEAVNDQIKLAQKAAGHDHVQFLQKKIQIEELAKLEADKFGDKKRANDLDKQIGVDKTELDEARKEKAHRQENFDRDIKRARAKREDEDIKPYMPTLEELANSSPWDPGLRRNREFSERQSNWLRAHGMTYGQREGSKRAQEMLDLQQDAKRAYFDEGPKSERLKEDRAKLKTLKDEMRGLGLLSKEDRLDSIDDNIASLLAKAEEDGLKIQPVNGK